MNGMGNIQHVFMMGYIRHGEDGVAPIMDRFIEQIRPVKIISHQMTSSITNEGVHTVLSVFYVPPLPPKDGIRND